MDILDLGKQYLTGVFPATKEQKIGRSPLQLVKCSEESANDCGLLQLKHSYSPREMFAPGYGYRSGLNKSMVLHLERIVSDLLRVVKLKQDDIVVDIGSNDGTLLKAYPPTLASLVGVDPVGKAFEKFYPEHITLIPDFFSEKLLKDRFGERKAKVVTSIAMFYDLESPLVFANEVSKILAQDGVWHFEQSYMPTMLQNIAYDTVCHEHLEYYRLKQIKWIADMTGFKIVGLSLNSINGGSFAATFAKKESSYRESVHAVKSMLAAEERAGLSGASPYLKFSRRVHAHREEMRRFVENLRSKSKRIFGLGASTKGNVLLQFCGFSSSEIEYVADVNEEKFGHYTPGSLIPIISEEAATRMKPDVFLVLPWHFKDYFIENRAKYGESLLAFPLPKLSVHGRS